MGRAPCQFSVFRFRRCTMRNLIARLWMVVAAGSAVGCIKCPDHCSCSEWEGLVRTDCAGRNLINTFVGFSHRTQILDLSHNVISILHGNEFLDANLWHVQEINLSDNRLEQIDKFSFNGLRLLKKLDLSFNSIEYLNPGTFKYNPDLTTLNVSYNPLRLADGEAFLTAPTSLRVLDLTACRLRSATLRTFSKLESLTVLNVSRNRVQNLEFLEGMHSLRYLDVSMNGFECDEQTELRVRSLVKRKIRFPDFCQMSQKMSMPLSEEENETFQLDSYREDYQNVTERTSQKRSLVNDVVQFFQSIPAFYAIVCGVQMGIFIGSFSTYFCLRKSNKNRRRHGDVEDAAMGRTRYRLVESDNLIPLNTPPGTPPDPYRSRIFPSTFSLPTT